MSILKNILDLLMKSVICLVCLITSLAIGLHAQRFGGDKPSVPWRQVNTATARVIFPKGLDSAAIRVAAIVQQLSKSTIPTIGPQQKKIDIVLHPNTTISNGYVALGPFRSEFYLTPSQNSFDLGSLRWQDMLSIHEYRHVQQYNNFNVGLSKVFRILFGQEGQELANALAVPNWFWEGDAVFQETLVSNQGRGRLPFFYNDYRSLWLAGKKYSYMKLRNGSLRDFTPDHYRLGYMMVAYGREKYGDDFWRKTTRDAAAFKGLFYPFQKAVKQYAGAGFNQFTNDALNYFKNQGAHQAMAPTAAKHFIADEAFPAYAADDAIVYMKSSYKRIPFFVERKNNEERKIRIRDVSLDNQFSYRNGKIVYASYRPGARWSWNDFSELQVLDVHSGRQKTITRHTKYFSPDISEDGKTIVAVDVQPGGKTRLHLIDAENGLLVKEIPNSENLFYTYPKFINQEQIIATVRKSSGEMVLALINSNDGTVQYLTAAAYRVLGNPVVQHDTIYFTASDQQYDKLFALSLNNKKLYRLLLATNGIGAYQPAVKPDTILFSTFTANGYQLQQLPKKEMVWQEMGEAEWTAAINSFGIDLTKNSAAGLLSSVETKNLETKKYSSTTGLFNFHSLLPYITDPDYSLSLVGNNVLNTMQSELFVSYNLNEQYKQLGFNGTYSGLFPYISLGGSYIIDRRDFLAANKPLYWNESQLNAGLSIPLNLSKGRTITNLLFGSDYVFKNISYQGVYKDSIGSNHLAYINSYVSFTGQSQKARQQIYPRFAQAIYLNYRNAVQNADAWQFLASGSFYVPGFSYTHNIVLNAAYQFRDTLNFYRFTNSFPFSRGYESPNLRNMYKLGANYHLPLAYPDWGFANMVYFQRIRANLFYDYTVARVAYNNGLRIDTKFRSTGAEIFFDTKWWNQLPLNFGFRYSHLLDADLFGATGSERFEFVLPVNLFQR